MVGGSAGAGALILQIAVPLCNAKGHGPYELLSRLHLYRKFKIFDSQMSVTLHLDSSALVLTLHRLFN